MSNLSITLSSDQFEYKDPFTQSDKACFLWALTESLAFNGYLGT